MRLEMFDIFVPMPVQCPAFYVNVKEEVCAGIAPGSVQIFASMYSA